MQQQLEQLKLEEERRRQEEEEKQRALEEAENRRLEKVHVLNYWLVLGGFLPTARDWKTLVNLVYIYMYPVIELQVSREQFCFDCKLLNTLLQLRLEQERKEKKKQKEKVCECRNPLITIGDPHLLSHHAIQGFH